MTTNGEPSKRPPLADDDPMRAFYDRDRDRIGEAIAKAGREAATRHRKLGHPLVVYKDGRTQIIPPEEIPIFDDCE